MAPKRTAPLEKPPAPPSSEEEEPDASVQKKPEDSSESETLAKHKANVKPVASKPMAEATKPAAATASPAKRALRENEEAKETKKGEEAERVEGSKNGDEGEGEGVEGAKKLFQRIWNEEDELMLLKGMHLFKRKKAIDPFSDMGAFQEYIKNSLKGIVDVTKLQLQDKIKRLKKKFENKKKKPTKPHEAKIYELSQKVWGEGGQAATGASVGKGKANSSRNGNGKRIREEPGAASTGIWCVDDEVMKFGFPESLLKEGLEKMDEETRAGLDDRWHKLRLAYTVLFRERIELMKDEAQLVVEALNK